MKDLQFRLLEANEIDCRVAQCGTMAKGGAWCSVLLYKDARVDMRLLDEVVGAFNWKREHELINGNLFCTVSIYNAETKEWVSKQDVGTESNTEKEKGQASDAFKRACFNWGIGRELYTSPFVWINTTDADRNQARKLKTRFKVKEIEYKDDKVSKLVIVDDKGVERFTFGCGKKQDKAPNTQQKSQAEKNMPYEDRLGAAVLDVEACNSVDELTAIWHAYKADFGEDARFVDALKERKAALNK